MSAREWLAHSHRASSPDAGRLKKERRAGVGRRAKISRPPTLNSFRTDDRTRGIVLPSVPAKWLIPRPRPVSARAASAARVSLGIRVCGHNFIIDVILKWLSGLGCASRPALSDVSSGLTRGRIRSLSLYLPANPPEPAESSFKHLPRFFASLCVRDCACECEHGYRSLAPSRISLSCMDEQTDRRDRGGAGDGDCGVRRRDWV